MIEPWYRDGLRFECNRCGRCCRGEPGYVWVSLREISEMAVLLRMTIDGFCSKYVRRVDDSYSLVEKPNGDCVFYEDGCKVYAARPVQCRTFPFWPEYLTSEKSWRRAMARCPGVGKGRLHSAAEIDEALELMGGA